MKHTNKNRKISICIKKLQEILSYFFMYAFSEKCNNIMLIHSRVSPILFASSKNASAFPSFSLWLLLLSLPYVIQWWVVSENMKRKIKVEEFILKLLHPRNAQFPSYDWSLRKIQYLVRPDFMSLFICLSLLKGILGRNYIRSFLGIII